jgi:hypothetical protein
MGVAVVIGPAAAAALTRLVGVARVLADTTGVADGSLLEKEKKILQEIWRVQVINARRNVACSTTIHGTEKKASTWAGSQFGGSFLSNKKSKNKVH